MIDAPQKSVPTRLPQKLETDELELVCTLGKSHLTASGNPACLT